MEWKVAPLCAEVFFYSMNYSDSMTTVFPRPDQALLQASPAFLVSRFWFRTKHPSSAQAFQYNKYMDTAKPLRKPGPISELVFRLPPPPSIITADPNSTGTPKHNR